MTESLTDGEKQTLLRIARDSIEHAARGEKLPPLDKKSLTPRLLADGASFVTLTIRHELRGCIGALESYQPLADDAREHAIAAALHDPRFPPVSEFELNQIQIEVSVLTAPQPLGYLSGEELIATLRPRIDGVILKDGQRRATFLPQVWGQIPSAPDFLNQLCAKMGAPRALWQNKKLEVFTYQVEEFHE